MNLWILKRWNTDRIRLRLTPSTDNSSSGVTLSAQRVGAELRPVEPPAFPAGGAPRLTAETDYFRRGKDAQVGFPTQKNYAPFSDRIYFLLIS